MSGFKLSDFENMKTVTAGLAFAEQMAHLKLIETKHLCSVIKAGSALAVTNEKDEDHYCQKKGVSKQWCKSAVDVFYVYVHQRKQHKISDALDFTRNSSAYAGHIELLSVEKGL